MHSALGKRHGLTDNDLANLSTISESNFQHKEWVALKYVYEWTVPGGNEPSGDYMKEYKTLYSEKERARINKLMRLMLFSNYFSNFVFRKAWQQTA